MVFSILFLPFFALQSFSLAPTLLTFSCYSSFLLLSIPFNSSPSFFFSCCLLHSLSNKEKEPSLEVFFFLYPTFWKCENFFFRMNMFFPIKIHSNQNSPPLSGIGGTTNTLAHASTIFFLPSRVLEVPPITPDLPKKILPTRVLVVSPIPHDPLNKQISLWDIIDVANTLGPLKNSLWNIRKAANIFGSFRKKFFPPRYRWHYKYPVTLNLVLPPRYWEEKNICIFQGIGSISLWPLKWIYLWAFRIIATLPIPSKPYQNFYWVCTYSVLDVPPISKALSKFQLHLHMVGFGSTTNTPRL